MDRISLRLILYSFFCYVVMQLPFINKLVFLGNAFGFFYLGFLLFLPLNLNPFLRIFLGFAIGLIIDVFSNTPGMHASAATLLMFSRDWWFVSVMGEPDDSRLLSIYTIGIKGLIFYLLPLIFIYMLMVFFIEHGSMTGFLMVFARSFNSSVFTLAIIVTINYAISGRPQRI